MMPAERAFWQNRRVLVTGHTGFKGAWLSLMLMRLGAKVTGIGLPPEPGPSAFASLGPWHGLDHHILDIRDGERLKALVQSAKPEIVLHLAAQALVRRSYREPAETFSVNVGGTINLLQGLRGVDGTKAILVVTSDKVYRNDGSGRPFREDDPLGGSDPYSASKAACEIAVASFRASFGSELAPLATARAGNVIGGGDHAEDRIVPDIVRAIRNGAPLTLRYPNATRPWQHVLDLCVGYLLYAQALAERRTALPDALNFGPELDIGIKVSAIVDEFAHAYGRKISYKLLNDPLPEQPMLALDSRLAMRVLGWRPKRDARQAIAETVNWYRAQDRADSMQQVSLSAVDAQVAT